MKRIPNLYYEKKYWGKGFFVIGIDEVGRGSFAGPLVLAGVVFAPTKKRSNITYLQSLGIDDSKKLKSQKREELSKIIKKEALHFIQATVPVSIINKKGIVKAEEIGVRKIIKSLQKKLKEKKLFLLMDAFSIKYVSGIGLRNQKGIIHGDEISLSIAAASIIAKVKRDKIMQKLSLRYPKFEWGKNKGYGTERHRAALRKHGSTILHRVQFITRTMVK